MWCWKTSPPWALPIFVVALFQLQTADHDCSSWEHNLFLFTKPDRVFFPSSAPVSPLRRHSVRISADTHYVRQWHLSDLPCSLPSQYFQTNTVVPCLAQLHYSAFPAPVKKSVNFFFFLLHSLRFDWMILRCGGFLMSYIYLINLSVKESTFYHTLLSVHYLLTSIYISLYI